MVIKMIEKSSRVPSKPVRDKDRLATKLNPHEIQPESKHIYTTKFNTRTVYHPGVGGKSVHQVNVSGEPFSYPTVHKILSHQDDMSGGKWKIYQQGKCARPNSTGLA